MGINISSYRFKLVFVAIPVTLLLLMFMIREMQRSLQSKQRVAENQAKEQLLVHIAQLQTMQSKMHPVGELILSGNKVLSAQFINLRAEFNRLFVLINQKYERYKTLTIHATRLENTINIWYQQQHIFRKATQGVINQQISLSAWNQLNKVTDEGFFLQELLMMPTEQQPRHQYFITQCRLLLSRWVELYSRKRLEITAMLQTKDKFLTTDHSVLRDIEFSMERTFARMRLLSHTIGDSKAFILLLGRTKTALQSLDWKVIKEQHHVIDLFNQMEKMLQSMNQRQNVVTNQSAWFQFGSSIVIGLISLFSLFLLISGLSKMDRKHTEINRVLSSLAGGDFSQRIMTSGIEQTEDIAESSSSIKTDGERNKNSGDEVDEVARHVNHLAINLGHAGKIGKVTSNMLTMALKPVSTHTLLDYILRSVLTLDWFAEGSKGVVYAYDQTSDQLLLQCDLGYSAREKIMIEAIAIDQCYCGLDLADHKKIVVNQQGGGDLQICYSVKKNHVHYYIPVMYHTFFKGLMILESPLKRQRFLQDGTFLSTISSTLANIFEKKHVDNMLLKAKREAEYANQSKSAFLANMSHEIRTPMNAILGFCYMVKQTDLNPQQGDYIDKIYKSGELLLEIINDILDLSKIEAEKLQIEQIPFRLLDVLQDVTFTFSEKINHKQLELAVFIDPTIPDRLNGDPLRIKQVLINLVSNAIKFTDHGVICLEVVPIVIKNKVATVRFSVKDMGIGIDEAKQNELFKSFTQADTSTTRVYGGTGLGLSICKRLVALMKGKIWVNSVAEKGSTFSFSLPLDFDEPLAIFSIYQKIAGLNVLLINDEPVVRELLSKQLEAFQCRVQAIDSSSKCLYALQKSWLKLGNQRQYFDIVLIDWQLNAGDRLSVVERVKRGFAPYIRYILLMTASPDEHYKKGAAHLAISGTLFKPFDPSQLLSKLLHFHPQGIVNAAMPLYDNQPGIANPAILLDDKNNEFFKFPSGLKVLVVEDTIVNQQLMEGILKTFNLQVIIAEDGYKAIQYLQQSEVSGVLMDIQMPRMDGFQTTRYIRAELGMKHLPIIAVTAHALSEEGQKCLAGGMDDYLTKPIVPLELNKKLKRWLLPVADREEGLTETDVAGNIKTLGEPGMPAEPTTSYSAAIAIETQDYAIAGLSIPQLLKHCNNNHTVANELLHNFHDHYKDMAVRLRGNLAQNNQKALVDELHTFKGLLGTIGAGKIRQIVKVMHGYAQKGQLEMINRAIDDFALVFMALIEELGQWCASHPRNKICQQHSGEGEQSICLEDLIVQVVELCALLERGNAMAIEKWKATYVAIAAGLNASHHPALKEIDRCISQYDFDDAHGALLSIVQVLQEPRSAA